MTRRSACSILLLLLAGCAWLTGGAKKDPEEAVRESRRQEVDVQVPADMAAAAPQVEVREEALGSVGDTLAEAGVIVAFATAVTGLVWLFRHRLPMFNLLVATVAMVLSVLAFFNAAT